MNRPGCWKAMVLAMAGLVAASLGTTVLMLALALLVLAPPAWSAEPAASPVGEWWTPGFGARVRIEPCGDALCGRIVWVWDEASASAAGASPLVGRQVVSQMRAEGGQRWAGGRLFNPEDGREYRGSLQLASPSRLLLDGCVLVVCRQQVWRRADEARCPPVAAARP